MTSPQTAVEWLEEIGSREDFIAFMTTAASREARALIAILRDAKAEMDAMNEAAGAKYDATHWPFGWETIERNFAEGKYR